jgi:hypothetical protein
VEPADAGGHPYKQTAIRIIPRGLQKNRPPNFRFWLKADPVPPVAGGEDFLASGVLKENIFRIGDDWGRIDGNEDNILGRKDKRGE